MWRSKRSTSKPVFHLRHRAATQSSGGTSSDRSTIPSLAACPRSSTTSVTRCTRHGPPMNCAERSRAIRVVGGVISYRVDYRRSRSSSAYPSAARNSSSAPASPGPRIKTPFRRRCAGNGVSSAGPSPSPPTVGFRQLTNSSFPRSAAQASEDARHMRETGRRASGRAFPRGAWERGETTPYPPRSHALRGNASPAAPRHEPRRTRGTCEGRDADTAHAKDRTQSVRTCVPTGAREREERRHPLVPTLRVGTQAPPLRGTNLGGRQAHAGDGTQSVRTCVSTGARGNEETRGDTRRHTLVPTLRVGARRHEETHPRSHAPRGNASPAAPRHYAEVLPDGLHGEQGRKSRVVAGGRVTPMDGIVDIAAFHRIEMDIFQLLPHDFFILNLLRMTPLNP